MYKVEIIVCSSKYADEYGIDIVESHEFEEEKEAKKKEKELISEYDLNKVGHTYLNRDGQELKTNY